VAVVVAGGGITGLAAAWELARAGIAVELYEASERFGGKIRTEHVDGFLLEDGPDSFISYRPAAAALARELGLGGEIIGTTDPRTVHIRTGGHFVPLPDGIGLVLPTRMAPFVTTRLFSPLEKLAMARDLVLPRSPAGEDVSIGWFLRRRLGPALVARLGDPLIGGIYGASVDELSLDAVVPQLRTAEREHRSLLLASLAQGRARARAAAAGSPAPKASSTSSDQTSSKPTRPTRSSMSTPRYRSDPPSRSGSAIVVWKATTPSSPGTNVTPFVAVPLVAVPLVAVVMRTSALRTEKKGRTLGAYRRSLTAAGADRPAAPVESGSDVGDHFAGADYDAHSGAQTAE